MAVGDTKNMVQKFQHVRRDQADCERTGPCLTGRQHPDDEPLMLMEEILSQELEQQCEELQEDGCRDGGSRADTDESEAQEEDFQLDPEILKSEGVSSYSVHRNQTKVLVDHPTQIQSENLVQQVCSENLG